MDSSARPGLMMAYITQPDHTGHRRLGKPMNQTLKDVDEHLGNFLKELDDEGFLGCVNLVLVSDHGMTRLYDHLVLSDYLNVSDYEIITGPESQIYLKNSSQKVEDVLEKFSCKLKIGCVSLPRQRYPSDFIIRTRPESVMSSFSESMGRK